jgi:hypothetical protein
MVQGMVQGMVRVMVGWMVQGMVPVTVGWMVRGMGWMMVDWMAHRFPNCLLPEQIATSITDLPGELEHRVVSDRR